MPRIPTAETFTPNQQQVGVRVNQSIGSAPFQALQRVGGAVKDVSNFMENFAQEKQRLVNEGHIADAKARAIEAEQEIENEIAQEQDYTKWGKIAENKWKSISAGVEKNEALSPVVRSAVTNFYTDAKSRSLARVSGMTTKREIQTANANLVRLATKLRANGDRDGAIAELNKLNMDPIAKERMIQQTLEEGAYQEVFHQIQVNWGDEQQLDVIMEGLTSKNAEGEFTGHEGLGYDSRITLQNQILARKRDIARTKAITARNINRKIARGEATIEEINAEEAAGNLDPKEAEIQRQQVDHARKYEATTSADYKEVKSMIHRNWAEKFFLDGWADGVGFQPSDKQYQDILGKILEGDISREGKNDLMEMALDLKAMDLSDGQEEKGRWWGDRKFSKAEKDLRLDLVEAYRDAIDAIGYESAGSMMMNQEKVIREWFDKRGGDVDVEELKAFKNTLMHEVKAVKANQIVDDTFSDF